MTIAPLPTPYNGDTHARIHNIHLDGTPAVVHFRLGRFVAPEGVEDFTPPEMPYMSDESPLGWAERAELNTAELNAGVTSLADIVVAIDATLQAHA